MAADVNDIIAYGFGSWSSVNSIPTLGFGIGSAADIICITAEVVVQAGTATVETPDELNAPDPLYVRSRNADMPVPATTNTWTPATGMRTWYPADKVRTWKV